MRNSVCCWCVCRCIRSTHIGIAVCLLGMYVDSWLFISHLPKTYAYCGVLFVCERLLVCVLAVCFCLSASWHMMCLYMCLYVCGCACRWASSATSNFSMKAFLRLLQHLYSAINHLLKDLDAFGQQTQHWVIATPLQRPLCFYASLSRCPSVPLLQAHDYSWLP